MNIPETAKKIKDSCDWIDIDGSIYAFNKRNNQSPYVFKKVQQQVHGYLYCGINYDNGKRITKRVHRLVAEAFIPNPNNYDIVGHKNNIKNDNRVENLYWTTIKENTQKAFDDGLAHNDKGFDDSQSKPVKMYNTYTNEFIKEFGSISIASIETGITKTTIARQAKYKRPVRRPFYFRYSNDESLIIECQLIGQYDYDSDKLIQLFYNINEASRKTGIKRNTISAQVNKGKPKHKFLKFYFQKIKHIK